MFLTMCYVNDGGDVDKMEYADDDENGSGFCANAFNALVPRKQHAPATKRNEAIAEVEEVVAKQQDVVGAECKFLVSLEDCEAPNLAMPVTNQSHINDDREGEGEINAVANYVVVHG